MKVALLTDGIFPYVIGGMQKHSFYLARYLAQAGVEVDLYHFNQSDKDISLLELFSEEEKKHIRSFVIPFPKNGNLPGHYIRSSFIYSQKVYEAFLENGPVDYIYAKGFSAWKMLDAKRKGKSLPPVGINLHGYEMFQPAASFRSSLEQVLLRSPVRFMLSHTDHVYSYGGKITELLLENGVLRSRIKELPTGIDRAWLAEKASGPNPVRRFIFVGRYERRKGIEELNAVLKSLKGMSFEFVFAGPIPEMRQLRLSGVSYAGSIQETGTMMDLLRKSDILVCPSHSEGMPNVIMEAMASGLSVIATDVGAVSAMVDASNGWLIAPGSEQALREAMVSALDIPDEELLMKKKESLRKVETEFLWEKLIPQLIAGM
ncbi:MAG TPA: glycosyltransferase family 4 protein [Bacteroidia bacterium]|jgi:glycosyltransferase involved in cell wall biosynthesis|nr:glycosyltransferase family 4 protein [Bacteroidia bacterium]